MYIILELKKFPYLRICSKSLQSDKTSMAIIITQAYDYNPGKLHESPYKTMIVNE